MWTISLLECLNMCLLECGLGLLECGNICLQDCGLWALECGLCAN